MSWPFKSKPPTDVKQLQYLPEEVLTEIVLESKEKLSAQFTSHLATEQRGFTLGGLALAAVTTSISGYLSIDEEQSQNVSLVCAYLVFSIGMGVSALLSLISVRPKRFHIPGSEPKDWFLSTWPSGRKRDLKTTRLEQLKITQGRIEKNERVAASKAWLQISSLAVAGITVAVSGHLVFFGNG
jgi:hypothetical protein